MVDSQDSRYEREWTRMKAKDETTNEHEGTRMKGEILGQDLHDLLDELVKRDGFACSAASVIGPGDPILSIM